MSNALEAASLIMVPSGYEDGTLGSLKPTDGSGDFTFTRGSNLSATRINEQGYIEKGYENLLLQSNQFDTTWQSVRVSESTGFAGYDGTNDAWKIVPNTQLGDHRLDQSTSVSGVWTFSIYAKAAGYDFLYILFSGIGNSGKVIDISPNQGVVVDSKGGVQAIDESITDVGNDWWKITLTYSGTLGTLRIITLPANDTSTYAGDGVSGILIQDAMLNQGLAAYPYIETTTAPVAGGILEDMPRLDWSGSCPSLLLEPSRTNLFPHSEYFMAASWASKTGFITEENTNETLSPEGYYNATKFIATNTDPVIFDFLNVDVAPYVFTFYAKGKGSTIGKEIKSRFLYLSSATGQNQEDIFTLTGDWQRFEAKTTPTGAGDLLVRIDFPAETAVIGDEAYLYGVQFEQGSYPTSYIPTYGVSQTRLGDVCMNAGTQSLFNNDGGVLYAEVEPLTNGSDVGTLSLRGAGSTATGLLTLKFNYGINTLQYFIYNAGVLEHNRIVSFNLNQKIKVAAKYSIGECVLYINGIKQYTRAEFTGFAANTLQDMSFNTFSTEYLEAKVNQVLYFPTALSDEECIALTTIT